MCFLRANVSVCRQQASGLIVSEFQGQTLVTVCELKPCSFSNDFAVAIHLLTCTRARARTHASAPNYHHRSPGVSWSKFVLASRAQQGQVKKKKKNGRKNHNSCSVFASHSCNTLGFHLTAFHPFIILIGMRKSPGSSRGSYSVQYR